jgi:hypothetical protein
MAFRKEFTANRITFLRVTCRGPGIVLPAAW